MLEIRILLLLYTTYIDSIISSQTLTGRTMSKRSRERLLQLWSPSANDIHLRREAFQLWSATIARADLPVLKSVENLDPLAALVIAERAKRADRSVVPMLIEKIEHHDGGYWWQFCRHVWSVELTATLDRTLNKRGNKVERRWGSEHGHNSDWMTSEIIMTLSSSQAEAMLLHHWDHLKFSSRFVQAALFVATPALAKAVSDVVAACPEPNSLFKYLTTHLGYKNQTRPRLSRIVQMQGLLPYLSYLDGLEVFHLWDLCNDNGWFDLRREHIDAIVDQKYAHCVNGEAAQAELDKLASKDQYYWGRRWADQMEKSGWSIDQTIGILADWLKNRPSLNALKVASHVVLHVGQRRHVALLRSLAIEPATEVDALVAHADFAVQRRSLY